MPTTLNLIVPAAKRHTELQHINDWADTNNSSWTVRS